MKLKKLMLAVLSVPFILTGCKKPAVDPKSVMDTKVKAATKMTNAQLLDEAKKETGLFLAYGNSSRIAAAVENFRKAYPDLGLDTNSNGTKLSDAEIYTKLQTEATVTDNSKGASFVLIQDSATLDNYIKNSDILTNYYSDQFKDDVGKDGLVPLVHQYINKLFIWNNTAGDAAPKITNVWQLTEEKFKDKIYFKSPTLELVNMNFLITLTSPAWNTKMEAAYKEWKGSDYKKGDYQDASHEWIAKFLNNCSFAYESDTKMAAGVAKKENSDKIGLFVLSKLRDKSVEHENLTVGAWEEKAITPFSGFMYALYCQLVTRGPRPYTAMLFTNYMMTQEGFAPWNTAVGGYSANRKIPAFQGDKDLSFYTQHLVIEDGAYINTVKVKEQDWINRLIPAQKK